MVEKMIYLLQQMQNGIMAGSVYALIAVGFTLVFGVLKVLNLAHPEVLMVGAIIGLISIVTYQSNFFVATLAAMVISALLGIIIYQVAVRPTLKGGPHGPLLATMGVSIALQNFVARVFSPQPQYFPSIMAGKVLLIGPLAFPAAQLIGLALTLILMVLLSYYVWRTKGGKAIRATAENPEIAECLGVNTQATMAIAFAISSALGGITGVMIGGIYGFAFAYMGMRFGLMSLIAMLVGGMGSIPGAVVAGLGVGIVENLAIGFGMGTFREGILYGVLVLVLVVRPAGLFGRVIIEE
jgi:branched-chain amino acid transport system permease protein